MNHEKAFLYACYTGNLNIAKRVFEMGYEDKYSSYARYYFNVFLADKKCIVFRNVCKLGHLNVAKWLLEIKPEINTWTINFAFRLACQNNRLEVAKWLLKKKTENDDFFSESSGEINYDFRRVCENGYLEVAKWLFEIKPTINTNISTNNEYPFRMACSNGHVEVAKWLQSLRPWLYQIQILENNEMKYHVNSPEEQVLYFKEQRFQRRKMALFLSKFPNDSLMFQLPSDISRYIITNFL